MAVEHLDQHLYMSAAEAADLLRVKPQTLYSYASRGLIRRAPEPGSTRSMYQRADIEQLAARQNTRKSEPYRGGDPERTDALPQIGSSVTEISNAGPRYRGRLFRELATRPGQFENVAELLWSGVLLDEAITWDADVVPQNLETAVRALQAPGGYVPILRILSVACLVLGESASDELRSGSTARLARRLVSTFAACLGVLRPPTPTPVRREPAEPVAHHVLRSLGAEPTAAAVAGVNAVLIACADHELSPATYAVRVAASTGAGLHACLSAGLSAHSGHHLGGKVDRIEDMIASCASSQDLSKKLALSDRLALGTSPFLPYRSGDPRGRFLFEVAAQVDTGGRWRQLRELIAATDANALESPSLELGLIAVARALELPRRAPAGLWVLGRSVGWVAHVIEQRLAASVIRPRARPM